MWTIIVLAVILGLVALVLFLLWVPIDIVLQLQTEGNHHFTVRSVWLFGLINKQFAPMRRQPRPVAEPPSKPVQRTSLKGRLKVAVMMWRNRRLLPRLVDLGKELISRFKIKSLDINLRVGLDNPADTAMLFGIVGAIIYAFPASLLRRINLLPIFTEPALEGYAYGIFTVHPIELIPPLIKFASSRDNRDAIKSIINARKQAGS